MMTHPKTTSVMLRKLSPLFLALIFIVVACRTSQGVVINLSSSSTTEAPATILPYPTTVDLSTSTSAPTLITATSTQPANSPVPPTTNVFPVVIYPPYDSPNGYLLGGTQNGFWIDSIETARLLRGDEQYWLYTDREEVGRSFGSVPIQNSPICPNWYEISLAPLPASPSTIAIGGDWNALPRIPLEMSTDSDVYHQALGELLQANGITSGDIQITRLLRIDLEGDGKDEVVMSAAHFVGETGHQVEVGDYSVIAVRAITSKGVETLSLVADYYLADNELAFPNRYELVGILDLNGDGQMEVIVQITGWEKLGTLGYLVSEGTVTNLFDVRCP